MNKIFTKGRIAFLTVLSLVIIDQITKITVKTNMYYGESIHITDWFYINFIENSGMAFGMQIMPKAIQTVFRIIVSIFLGYFLVKLVKKEYKTGFIVAVSLIMAGAIGNILDSVFYGAIFSQSTFSEVSTFVPIGQGYADFLYGKVVDMFYFPLFEFVWPEWVPIKGGETFIFFSPVFNFADAAVSCGMIVILLFYSRSFSESMNLAINGVKEKLKKTN